MKAYQIETSQDRRASYYSTQIRPHGQKYPHFHWPSQEIFLNFIYTYHRLGDLMEDLFNTHGLSRSGFNALMILSRSHPQGCIQQDLSKLLLVSRANITGIVNGLVQQGLATRNLHPKDRRAHIVKISKKGKGVLKHLIPQYHKKIYRLLSFLDPAERKTFKGILERIQQGVENDRKQNLT